VGVKQSQFGGGARKQAQWAGRHRENYAKQTQFAERASSDKCFMEKGLGSIARAPGPGKTKPIGKKFEV
jgi:hypothetical protein